MVCKKHLPYELWFFVVAKIINRHQSVGPKLAKIIDVVLYKTCWQLQSQLLYLDFLNFMHIRSTPLLVLIRINKVQSEKVVDCASFLTHF